VGALTAAGATTVVGGECAGVDVSSSCLYPVYAQSCLYLVSQHTARFRLARFRLTARPVVAPPPPSPLAHTGGDSVSAVKQLQPVPDITYISTGGGASLELVRGSVLPGIAALAAAVGTREPGLLISEQP
jgi:hypothetical protein